MFSWQWVDFVGSGGIFVLGALFSGWMALKIFSHLFCIENNWIIEPSISNKVYAVLAPIFICLGYISYAIMAILWLYTDINNTTYDLICDILAFFQIFGHIFYFLYMCSILEYNMNAELLFKEMISTKIIWIIKLGLLYGIIDSVAVTYLDYLSGYLYIYDGIDYSLISDVSLFIIKPSLEIMLLYLYCRGLNNLCHYWYSKRWDEYKNGGISEKSHEILIVITRSTIIVIISIITTLIYISWYGVYAYVLSADNDEINAIGDIIFSILQVIDDMTYCFSIYFIYPFGHVMYEKLLGKFHQKMYSYFQHKHQQQVRTGGFDGKRYQSQTKGCCFTKRNGMEVALNSSNIQC